MQMPRKDAMEHQKKKMESRDWEARSSIQPGADLSDNNGTDFGPKDKGALFNEAKQRATIKALQGRGMMETGGKLAGY